MNFQEVHKTYLDVINKELEAFLENEISRLHANEPIIKECYSMIKEYTLIGGKRLRPVSLILAYIASRGKHEKKAYLPAVAVELHQSYSLILDDLMDEDELRRGNPGINRKLKDLYSQNFKEEIYSGLIFNRKSSRFVASYAAMLANLTNILSRKAMLKSDFDDETKTKVLSVMDSADQEIYHGQMMDVLMEHKTVAKEQEYLEMIRLKTAAFFGMSLEIGAILAKADGKKIQHFNEFGICSAMSFQIQDDLIDIFGDKGHEQGSDIKKGKKTLLMIKALENATDAQLKLLKKAYGKSDVSETDLNKAISVIQDTGAVTYCKNMAMHYNKEAKNILTKMKLDLYYSLLFSEMTDFMIKRDH